ncbi:MAG: hypothetical protein Q9165_001184 [Trypethelium subeluteriae]
MPSDPGVVRLLVIGAGSRGNQYAEAVQEVPNSIVTAIAEPIEFKRKAFCKKWIWPEQKPAAEQEFDDWHQFVQYEKTRRKRAAAGESVEPGVEIAFICILDELHVEAITALAPLGLHIMSEKPLATTLKDCLKIYSSLCPEGPQSQPSTIFGIGHVLRYSPHNMLLRELLLEDQVIGEIISIEHTEPVGWWHFAHSYVRRAPKFIQPVRGNWRKESNSAPSLLTKSCHDIDFLLWLLSSSPPRSNLPPHPPSTLSSTGRLTYLHKGRKPIAAGSATNCLSCPIEPTCTYSAKKIYLDKRLKAGNTSWPVIIVNPEIEDLYTTQGLPAAEAALLNSLAENYDDATPKAEVEWRPWFGRCVWECDNDVCDDQVVTLTWDDDPLPQGQIGGVDENANVSDGGEGGNVLKRRMAKTATFHMIAYTEAQCHRRGRVYGTKGEIAYDSKTISVYDFASGEVKVHQPHQPRGGHGGGDAGLVRQFVSAVEAVRNGMAVPEAQKRFVGCSMEEIIRSHAVVFAAEEARREGRVVQWRDWWKREVEEKMNL